MAAGQGFKTFVTGEVLTAGDVNGYLMQGINVFATTAARDAAITVPAEGQFAFTKDTNGLWYYDGAAWVASGATGDIEGVTAGTGISGGGTSGTVTITNSMATAIDAKGDLIVGTGADTFSKLTAGTNGYLLTADSAEATGLKWAAAAGGSSGLTKISKTSFSNVASTTTSFDGVFTSTYDNYMLVMDNMRALSGGSFQFNLRNSASDLTANYGTYSEQTSSYARTLTDNASTFNFGVGNSDTNQRNAYIWYVFRNNDSLCYTFYGQSRNNNGLISGAGFSNTTRALGADGFKISASSGNVSGDITIYGLEK